MPRIIVTCLLAIQAALLCGLAWQTSVNRTEVGHVGAAVYFWQTGRFDVFAVNPPLTRILAGIPMTLASPNYDWKSYSPRPQDRSEWGIGSAFMRANDESHVRWSIFFARMMLVPLPMNFIQGIDTQRFDFERGLPSYLRGEWSDHGWWSYYLYALLIKTPLGTLGLFILAIFCTIFLNGYNVNWRDEMVVLLPGVVLLAFVSSQTGFSVHSRYAIPALPFFFIWMSKVGRAFELGHRKIQILVVVLLGWSILSTLSVYPHSLSYFNELTAVISTPHDEENRIPPMPTVPGSSPTWNRIKAILTAGPRNGPRHLLDSNIDWGQDLFYLETWCRKHPEVTKISVAYAGSYPMELTSIPSVGGVPANAPQPGWYALSVNYLYDKSGEYRYFLDHQPVALIGYSTYIYHITPEDANRIRRERGLPETESLSTKNNIAQESMALMAEVNVSPEFSRRLKIPHRKRRKCLKRKGSHERTG